MAATDAHVTQYVLKKGGITPAEISAAQKLADDSKESLAHTLLNMGKLTNNDLAILDIGNPPSQTLKTNSIEQSINNVLEYGVRARASDIHIEPRSSEIQVRFRIDGTLMTQLALPFTQQSAISTYLKKITGLDVNNSNLPQEGQFTADFGARPITFDLSTLPTTLGEKFFIHITDESTTKTTLSELGMDAALINRVTQLLKDGRGIGIVAASNSTITGLVLYALLKSYDATKKNLITVEHPILNTLPNVDQIALDPGHGYNFPTAIAAASKQNPNVLMVNPLSGPTSAELLIDSALTETQIFAGLISHDAITAILRLSDLGVEQFLIASTIRFVLATHRVRKLCPICRQTYVPTGAQLAILQPHLITTSSKASNHTTNRDALELHQKKIIPAPSKDDLARQSILDRIAADPNIVNRGLHQNLDASSTQNQSETTQKENQPKEIFYRAVGCAQCGHTGYVGQINLFELLEINDSLANIITTGAHAKSLRAEAHKAGFVDLASDAYEKAHNGIISLDDALSIL